LDFFGYDHRPDYLLGCNIFNAIQKDGQLLITGTTMEARIEDPMELVGEINIHVWGFPFYVTLDPTDKQTFETNDPLHFVNDLNNLDYRLDTAPVYDWSVDEWFCDGAVKVWGKIEEIPHKELWAEKLSENLRGLLDTYLYRYAVGEQKNNFIAGVHPLFVQPLASRYPDIKNWGVGK